MERINDLTIVNTTLPIGNQSFVFRIPPNTPSYSYDFNTRLPNHNNYYRWVSDITYRIDTSGIYNVETTQTITYFTPGANNITINPGYYTLNDLNTLFSGFMVPIPVSGANAFKASTIGGPLTVVNLANAPIIQQILAWPASVGPNFTASLPVDLTIGKDLMIVYADFVSQSAENNRTNLVAIPISPGSGTLGFIVNGNFHSKTPILAGKDVVGTVTITLTDASGNPYYINTEVFLNIKVLFALKYQGRILNKN
jgi:hypothetical protein